MLRHRQQDELNPTGSPRETCPCQRWHLNSERGLHLSESEISTVRQCGAIDLQPTRCSHTSIAVNFTGTLAPCAPWIDFETVWNKTGKKFWYIYSILGAEVGCWGHSQHPAPAPCFVTGCWSRVLGRCNNQGAGVGCWAIEQGAGVGCWAHSQYPAPAPYFVTGCWGGVLGDPERQGAGVGCWT